jgi:hypothetical protein
VRALAIVAIALASSQAGAAAYEDCILANMKGVQSQGAAVLIAQACRENTIPKVCRDAELAKPRAMEVTNASGKTTSVLVTPTPQIIAADREKCLANCAGASLWSRRFGACSVD